MDISKTGKTGAPGASGNGTSPGGKGGHGGKAVAKNYGGTDTTNTAEAYGGAGGTGGSGQSPGDPGGAGGVGGNAQSLACTSVAISGTTYAGAVAIGGSGGDGGSDVDRSLFEAGGAGGNATASAIDVNMLGSAVATAQATGGNGGNGGANGGGGAGGIAHGTTATAIGLTSATASVIQQGGNGGFVTVGGGQHARGGAAAASTLRNAVGGYTIGGTLTLSQEAIGGNGGDGVGEGGAQDGGAASSLLTFDDRQNPSSSKFLIGEVTAEGGVGGSVFDGPTPGFGGSSTARIALTGVRSITATALSGAITKGGAMGGVGGQALAVAASSSLASQAGDVVKATAQAIGGDGEENGALQNGGGGGAATAKASVFSSGAAVATAQATTIGGNGGYGFGSNGGSGASVSLVNAASGQTTGGSLTLVQSATGGNGADGGQGAGGAGNATSTLQFNDTTQSTRSASLSVSLTATGGNSGNPGLSFLAQDGGNAGAEATILGAGTVNVVTTAIAGNVGGGLTNTFNNNMTVAGGNATALSSGRGASVRSVAHATGGAGPDAGIALAQASGFGTSGSVLATAATSVTGTAAVLAVSSSATGVVASTGRAEALAQIGIASPVLDLKTPSLAFISGAPLASDVSGVLSANSSLNSAYGSAANVMALGELGGTYASHQAMGSETSSTSYSVSLEASQLNPKDDIVLGFYGPNAQGQNLGSVSLGVTVNGTTLVTASFSTAAAANAYFTDHPVDLGSIASLGAGGAILVNVSLSETGLAPGSGMFGGALLGQGTVTGNWREASVFDHGARGVLSSQAQQSLGAERLLSFADPHSWHS